jgi:hypothetical protein
MIPFPAKRFHVNGSLVLTFTDCHDLANFSRFSLLNKIYPQKYLADLLDSRSE